MVVMCPELSILVGFDESGLIVGPQVVDVNQRTSLWRKKLWVIAFCFFWQSQISVLQNRIEQLEQLLEENHEIISHIKDSVLELTANAEGPPALLPYHTANGSWVVPPEPRPSFFSISPQDCQFALEDRGQKPELQVRIRAGRDLLWPQMGH